MDRPDTLAKRIKERRQQGRAGASRPAAVTPPPGQATPASSDSKLRELRVQVERGGNVMAIARLLAAARDQDNYRVPEIAVALDRSRRWVNDHLNALLCNPIDQHALEAGTKTLWAVRQERKEKRAELARGERIAQGRLRRRGGAPYVRHARIVFDEDAAKAIAHVLDHTARSLGHAPITVEGQTHKQLQETIIRRAHELWHVLKPK